MRPPQMAYGDWLQIVLLALVWGISFFLTEICLRDFGPLTLATARVGLAAMVLLAFAAMRGENLPKAWTDWAPLAFMGLINNALPFSLIMWGQVSIDSGLASILNATTPLFTFIFAHFLTKDERMTRRGAVGVGIGFLGAVVLIGPGALTGIGAQSWGQMAVMAAAMSYAMAGIFGRRLSRFSPIVSAGCMTACAAVMLLPAALLLESPWTARPDLATWTALATLAVISTAFAYILYFRILASAGATNLLLVTFLIPIAAVLLGALALGEVVTLAALAGMLLIFLGLAVIDGRVFAALQRLRPGGNRQQAEPPNLP
ncbi:DMT family transporter [Pelagibius sp.]|uniref:DMT family transporter n=1 Tax=Pelagibius sp. TaxID=1931238 RepID=UPI0026337421|nr:DMT family transporter [Pelagibius sp.]